MIVGSGVGEGKIVVGVMVGTNVGTGVGGKGLPQAANDASRTIPITKTKHSVMVPGDSPGRRLRYNRRKTMEKDALIITDTLSIPESELSFIFSTSGGPGGQHANRAATRVTVRFDVVNLFDHVYELRDGTGIGVFAPQWGPRRGFFIGLSQKF